MTALTEVDLDKLAACSCGRNEPALFFCFKNPVCSRITIDENGKEIFTPQLIYCLTCSSEADSCHDHKQTMISVKCKDLHQDFGKIFNEIDNLKKLSEKSFLPINPIVIWAVNGAKEISNGLTKKDGQRNLFEDYKSIQRIHKRADEIREKFDEHLGNYKVEEMLNFQDEIKEIQAIAKDTSFMA